jgi:uracil-DNA glycosylase
MVKCPSSKKGKDHPPVSAAITNCSPFLRDELLAAEPERILALGRVPFNGICKIFGIEAPKTVAQFRKRVSWIRLNGWEVPMLGTYFVGNNRHRGFSAVIEDITRLLELKPRAVNG